MPPTQQQHYQSVTIKIPVDLLHRLAIVGIVPGYKLDALVIGLLTLMVNVQEMAAPHPEGMQPLLEAMQIKIKPKPRL